MTQTHIETAHRLAEAGQKNTAEAIALLRALEAESGAIDAAMDALEGIKAGAEEALVSLAARLQPVEGALMALEGAA
ncbi:MAG: hypothetical protein ACQRW7_05340 [Caulobacterales bacterium]|uniref:hypothetical protein n=1 Tax=Glycocaulis sp. TaxID=1969725 RepID=UPI003FA03BAB